MRGGESAGQFNCKTNSLKKNQAVGHISELEFRKGLLDSLCSSRLRSSRVEA